MINAILERHFEIPCTPEEILGTDEHKENCFNLHRVAWRQSLLSTDNRKLVCWFESPDLEAARISLRSIGADVRNLWSGSVHDAPDAGTTALESANVVVERRFDDTVEFDQIQALEEVGTACLKMRQVRFLRTLFSLDRKRMLCLYQAPDAESVREAQREAGVPFEAVWACRLVSPPA